MEQKLMEKESARRQQQFDNEMNLAREKSMTDAYYCRLIEEAEAYTPVSSAQIFEAIANNTKIYFCKKIPNMVFDQKFLSSYLENMAKMPSKAI